jgi:hypothetical protein
MISPAEKKKARGVSPGPNPPLEEVEETSEWMMAAANTG